MGLDQGNLTVFCLLLESITIVISQFIQCLFAGRIISCTILRSIDNNILISQLPDEQVASPDEVLSPGKLMEAYAAEPRLVDNALRLLFQCGFDFDFSTSKNRSTFTGNRRDDKRLCTGLPWMVLRDATVSGDEGQGEGAQELILSTSSTFRPTSLLQTIYAVMPVAATFTMWGGSGANSIVAYCLGITDVCPIELNLYFERFRIPRGRIRRTSMWISRGATAIISTIISFVAMEVSIRH